MILLAQITVDPGTELVAVNSQVRTVIEIDVRKSAKRQAPFWKGVVYIHPAPETNSTSKMIMLGK